MIDMHLTPDQQKEAIYLIEGVLDIQTFGTSEDLLSLRPSEWASRAYKLIEGAYSGARAENMSHNDHPPMKGTLMSQPNVQKITDLPDPVKPPRFTTKTKAYITGAVAATAVIATGLFVKSQVDKRVDIDEDGEFVTIDVSSDPSTPEQA